MNAIHALRPLLLALPLACFACTTPSRRVETPTRAARVAPKPPPPAPQVMIAAPAVDERGQIQLSPISEAERTELLRAAGSPIRSYRPEPFVSAPSTVVVRYEGDGGSASGYATGCDPLWSMARMAAYTGMGAVIGDQFCDAGAGAAIGAGVALLTTPWWGCEPWR